jgi:hypothetical protein
MPPEQALLPGRPASQGSLRNSLKAGVAAGKIFLDGTSRNASDVLDAL